jgi:hypothetical protein
MREPIALAMRCATSDVTWNATKRSGGETAAARKPAQTARELRPCAAESGQTTRSPLGMLNAGARFTWTSVAPVFSACTAWAVSGST